MIEGLLRAQSARFAGVDPLLPAAPAPPAGELLVAALSDGEQVVGVQTRTTHRPGAPQTLWSAMEVRELHPLTGAAGAAGLEALVRRWRRELARRPPGPDSSCVLTWPSRDAEAVAVMLRHGFVPLTVLAARAERVAPRPAPGVEIRLAHRADLDVLVRLALAEVAYATRVGGGVMRPEAERVKYATIGEHLDRGDPIWMAERDGVAVGMAEAWVTDSVPGSWARTRVPAGRWGFVNCVSVVAGARGMGVGRTLMGVVHADLAAEGAERSFLYYNPPNPLSPVFWARQGYRPLWTVWEVRPAIALR